MKYLHNPHPGEILLREFMELYQLTNYRLAKDLNIPESCVGKIVKCERRITAHTALRLEKYFGMDASFWLGLQNDYDILEEKRSGDKVYMSIKAFEVLQNEFGVVVNQAKSSKEVKGIRRKKPHSKDRILRNRCFLGDLVSSLGPNL